MTATDTATATRRAPDNAPARPLVIGLGQTRMRALATLAAALGQCSATALGPLRIATSPAIVRQAAYDPREIERDASKLLRAATDLHNHIMRMMSDAAYLSGDDRERQGASKERQIASRAHDIARRYGLGVEEYGGDPRGGECGILLVPDADDAGRAQALAGGFTGIQIERATGRG